MASNLGNLAATVSLNIDPFQASTRVLDTQMRSINRALTAQETHFKNNSKHINAQKASYDLTGKAIGVLNDKLTLQKKTYSDLAEGIGDVNKATVDQKTALLSSEAKINQTVGEIEALTGKYNELGKQIAINDSNWTKSGKVLEAFGNQTTKIGEGLSSFGSKWTKGVTMPIVAGVGLVTKAAMDWESSFAGVQKTVDEVVDKNGNVIYSYAELEQGLRNLAKELPATHTEIASVAEAAGQLGIASESVVTFTKTMIDLGESTNLSAEDAATSIARIANITGMTSDEYERFGSSLVALGNNFAATESEVLEMATRMASAGTVAGLTETEILGLATAMASVGIQSEAGGTAITQTLTAIEKAVDSGGDKLDKFAEISGMSSEKFAETWNQKPIDAIQSFIKGLGELDEESESTTAVLDELEMSGVRQSNMLRSLSLASDVLTGAVDMSNSAWSENTALSEEAQKRYATVESQLSMLKNEVVDIAIEFGGPFLEALRDGVQAAKPFIEKVGELAEAFSNANPETQQAIMKYIGLAAVIGPAAKGIGGFLKIVGGGASTIGKMSQWLGKVNGTAKASKMAFDIASTGASGLATSATAAAGVGSTGLAGLASGLGAMLGPAGIAVGAIAGVTLAVYAGKQAYDDYMLSGGRWGTEVTEEQDKVIKKSLELRDEATGYVQAFADGVEGSAQKAVEANQAIVDSIQAAIDKEYERKQSLVDDLEDPDMQSRAQQQIDAEKNVSDAMVKENQTRVDRINEIINSASENNRLISDKERAYITENYRLMTADQLAEAGFKKEEILAIETAYQTDLTKLTSKQQQERYYTLLGALSNEKAEYDKQAESLKDIYGNNTQAYSEEMDKLEANHKQKTENMILAFAKLSESQGVSIKDNQALWESWGWTVDEVAALVRGSVDGTTENLDMMAKSTDEAGMKWNSLVFDEKTGKVKTNMADTLLEIAKADDGWEQLEFMAKNADLTTNAKEEIAIALGQAGKWNDLYLTEQKMLVDNDDAMWKLLDTINELGLWDEYNADRKDLGIDNADAIWKLFETSGLLEQYNLIDTPLKQLMADGPATMNTEDAIAAINNFNELPEEVKKLLSDSTDVKRKVDDAKSQIDSWNEKGIPKKTITIAADTSGAALAKKAVDAVNGKTVYIDVVTRKQYVQGVGGKAYEAATGSPYFQGGNVWLGDGGKREPFLTPQGDFGISPSNWTLYNLPRGTKIWPSIAKMMETLPRYANGTKFDDTVLSRFSFQEPSNQRVDNLLISTKLDSVISLLSSLLNKDLVVNANGTVVLEDGRAIGRWIEPYVNNITNSKERRLNRNRGELQ